jgi:chromosome transmission fidelity protein 1
MNDDQLRDFHHPYEPYDIQTDFMNAVYDCLEKGKVGIFESPTGTGKSLSLICGSLTWLRDHKRRTFEDGFAVADASDEPAWILEHAQKQRKEEALRRKRELNERIAKVKAKEKRAKERFENGEVRYKRQKVGEAGLDDEAQFVLDDYESDDGQKAAFGESGLSAETQALMEKLGYAVGASTVEEGETLDETKIFFCSRTHSQLSQFTSELRRVEIPPAIASDEPDVDVLVEDVKHITLGSRKNLCINDKVSRLGNATAINERCVELQQAKSVEGRCPHMPSKESQTLLTDFRDHALAKVRDIEDLGVLGKKLGVCPYYASRPAIQHCEVRIVALCQDEANLSDRHVAVSASSTKIRARGTRSLAERPRSHYRRSTQLNGRYRRYLFGLRHARAGSAGTRTAYRLSAKVPEQIERQESRLCRADYPHLRLDYHISQIY